jgi:hypothetical protein
MTDNARRLRDGGHPRDDVTLAVAADVLWSCSSPELYELLVVRRGWSLTRYGRFVADATIAALLGGPRRARRGLIRRRCRDARAVRGTGSP